MLFFRRAALSPNELTSLPSYNKNAVGAEGDLMRYLVTGGAGFIGSNTVDELVRGGHGVVVLDDLSAGKEENLAEVRNKITFVKGSINDLETLQKVSHQADYVIHLAARTSVPRSVKDPIET